MLRLQNPGRQDIMPPPGGVEAQPVPMNLIRQTSSIDWDTAQSALRAWYATAPGAELHARIAGRVEWLVRDRYALHCLQIGGTRYGVDLLAGRGLIHRIHITGDEAGSMRAYPMALPLASGSIDFVLLCHALEFSGDPHALLREVDRVLSLDGLVLCVGFNPWSLLGLRGLWGRNDIPWCGRFYGPGRIGDWFALLGWRMQRRETLGLAPPVHSERLRRWLGSLERLHGWLPVQGGVHMLLGRKHSIPFTPVQARRLRAETRPVVGGVVRPSRYTEMQ